jgi:hypothetical protein
MRNQGAAMGGQVEPGNGGCRLKPYMLTYHESSSQPNTTNNLLLLRHHVCELQKRNKKRKTHTATVTNQQELKLVKTSNFCLAKRGKLCLTMCGEEY